MMSINKVTLMGHLGQDPKIVSFNNGSRVANLRIATSRRWRDRNTGESRENTQWHSVTLYVEQHVSLAERGLRKGSPIYIEGELEHQKWQDKATGQDRFTTVVAVRPYSGNMILLERRTEGAQGTGQGAGYSGHSQAPSGHPAVSHQGGGPSYNPHQGASYGRGYPPQGGGRPYTPGLDDEIPF